MDKYWNPVRWQFYHLDDQYFNSTCSYTLLRRQQRISATKTISGRRRDDGNIAGDRVALVDYADADNNDWLAVNQLTVIEGQHNRRPDVVVFVNGLPLAVIELKNPADEDATIWTAFN